MPIPNLIHPVPVTIQRQDASITLFDPVDRQPVRQMWKRGQGPGTGADETLSAQVNWNDGKLGEPKLSPGGVEEKSEGYFLVRVIDLIGAGIATENADGTVDFGIKRGDRITRIGRRKVDLYVAWFRDVAFYPDQGGGTLLEVQFVDRNPAEAG